MDLRLPRAAATEVERAAVDRVLGPPPSGWEGGERGPLDGHVARGGHASRARRHLLLPVLHALHDDVGWISEGALGYVCERLTIPPAVAWGVVSFYELFATEPTPPVVIRCCDDVICRTQGAKDLVRALAETIGPEGASDGGRTWRRTNCLGHCAEAPAILVETAGGGRRTAVGVTPGDVLDPPLAESSTSWTVIDSPVLTGRFGATDPLDLAAYRRNGGYEALHRAVEMGRPAVLDAIDASGLRGRGGAAFPTGWKWRAVADAADPVRHVVCNADESEPGTFKDRMLLERDPFAIVEGLTLAGYAVGATEGFVYVRGEYPEAERRLVAAVAKARRAGLLGDDVMGRGVAFDIEIRRGAGAYVCGEETALFESIEGRRGEPRAKPPYPTEQGLFGRPTAVNNVETLAAAVAIVAGVPGAGATKLFSVAGDVPAPGLVEAPLGTTVRELLTVCGRTDPPGAVLLGGAAGRFLGPAELDAPLGYDPNGPAMGSGAVMVFGRDENMVDVVERITAFFRSESCGQCVPCRVGTARQEEALRRLAGGSDEASLLADLAAVMRDASICGLGQTAAEAVSSALALGLIGGRS